MVTLRDRYLANVASLLVALAVTGSVVSIVAMRVFNDGPEPDGENWWLTAWVLAGIAYGAAGCVLLSKQAGRSLAAQFLTIGPAALLTAVSVQYAGYGQGRGLRPALPALAHAAGWAWTLAASVLVAVLPWSLLSAGQRARRSTRVLHRAGIGAAAITTFGETVDHHLIRAGGAYLVGFIGLVGVLSLTLMWWRDHRRGEGTLTGWLLLGCIAAWFAVVPRGLDVISWRLLGRDVFPPLMLLATIPLLVVGALIELLRRSNTRLDHPSPGTLEWLLLSTSIVFLYTGTVAGFGSLVGGHGPTWFLVAVSGCIALAIEPLRSRIRQLVSRLVFGQRDDTLAVVQDVVEHVTADLGDESIPMLVQSLKRALQLDAIAIDVVHDSDTWRRIATSGSSADLQTSVMLHHHDEVIGRLLVGTGRGPSLRPRDETLLAQLAGPLALALHSVQVSEDLRASRLAVVSAREEERRRLRRDLHDGIGPALLGASLGLRTALRQLQRRDQSARPDPTQELLARIADEVDTVAGEIKRIVRDLRPTALDQFGLMGAVTEFTRNLKDDLDIEVSLPHDVGPLPAAVEVTVYRIVTEALTNVVRHAHASHCWLSIDTDSSVHVDVVDDGIGLGPQPRDGVGITAMRERVSELGGSVEFLPDDVGTHLRVRLPAVLP